MSPQVGPTALLHCMSEAVAFLVMLRMCSLKLSLFSRVTPRNLADLDSSITHLNGSHGPFPVPGEHDNFGFHGADIKSFGLASGAHGFEGSLFFFQPIP